MFPPPSKASAVTDDRVFSHASAEAVASKKARVAAGSLTKDTVTFAPSAMGGTGSFTSDFLQEAKAKSAIDAINSLFMLIMILKVFNKPRPAAFPKANVYTIFRGKYGFGRGPFGKFKSFSAFLKMQKTDIMHYSSCKIAKNFSETTYPCPQNGMPSSQGFKKSNRGVFN